MKTGWLRFADKKKEQQTKKTQVAKGDFQRYPKREKKTPTPKNQKPLSPSLVALCPKRKEEREDGGRELD
jgi:hypothetical protein